MSTKITPGDIGLSKYTRKAEHTAKDPNRIRKLLEDSQEKIGKMAQDDQKVSGFIGMLKTLMRMLRAYLNGTYKIIPWKTLILMIGTMIYFVSPLDFIPDFIPIAGFVDDLSLVVWLFNRFQKDIRAFEEWELTQAHG